MHLKRLKMVIVLGLLIELISGVVGRTPLLGGGGLVAW